MSGTRLTNAIAADPALTTRVVLMTDFGQETDDEQSAESGVSASLSKPIHPEDLHGCLLVALDLQTADVAPIAGTARPPSVANQPQVGRLLLAEDNPINQKVAVAMLSSAGYQVHTVPDGAAAVQAVVGQHYDAILMDCQMPELSGYEATAAIRAHEGFDRHTPIIALTAGARREDRERCLAEGMDSYLSKPLSKDVLLALVAKTVKHGPTTTPPIARSLAAQFADVIDPDVFGELALLGDGEPGFLANLVNQFVRETEPRLAALRDALELDDALAAADIAHTIQGSGGQLGGRRLALACGRLELKARTGSLSGTSTDLQEVELDFQELRTALMQRINPVEHLPSSQHA
jgi:CheY-like chemotaxis protein